MMKKTAAIISACMLTFALSACSGMVELDQ